MKRDIFWQVSPRSGEVRDAASCEPPNDPARDQVHLRWRNQRALPSGPVQQTVAPAGVWLQQHDYQTVRIMLPEQPLSVWREAAPQRPPPPPPRSMSFSRVNVPAPPYEQRVLANTWTASAAICHPGPMFQPADPHTAEVWLGLKPDALPSPTGRYSVLHVTRERQWIVAMFGILTCLLTTLVMLVLIRLIIR